MTSSEFKLFQVLVEISEIGFQFYSSWWNQSLLEEIEEKIWWIDFKGIQVINFCRIHWLEDNWRDLRRIQMSSGDFNRIPVTLIDFQTKI